CRHEMVSSYPDSCADRRSSRLLELEDRLSAAGRFPPRWALVSHARLRRGVDPAGASLADLLARAPGKRPTRNRRGAPVRRTKRPLGVNVDTRGTGAMTHARVGMSVGWIEPLAIARARNV